MLTLIPALLALAPEKPAEPQSAVQPFAARQAEFAIALFRELAARPGNVVCSPLSLTRALGMARMGAAGETAREMDAVLRYPADAGAAFQALVQALEPPLVGRKEDKQPAYTLEIAASLWARESTPFQPDFLRRLKDGFASEMHAVDFREAEKARSAINAWTAQRTNDRIQEIIPAGLIDADTRLVLVDTVRFLGAWDEPFKAANTKTLPFTLDDGSTVQASLMHRVDFCSYAETATSQVVELPFQRGAMSLVVVLPKAGQKLDDVVRTEDFALWTSTLAARRVNVALPKFRFNFGGELKPVLQKLGLARPFQPGVADFSGMLAEPLMIGAVIQQAFVSVDENGAEAAAATAVMMVRGSAKPQDVDPVVFNADHPFVFFLRHRATGAVLFAGRVSDPTR
jgi:serpin B